MKPATATIGRTLTVIALLVLTAGCARMETEKGLDPTWHRISADTFQVGISTQSDVMRVLGPPSQVIPGQGGDILYYLHERAVGTGVVFIVYNQLQLKTRYDRAIFFFDEAGVLVDYAISEPTGADP